MLCVQSGDSKLMRTGAALQAACLPLFASLIFPCQAQVADITPFRLTGVEGFVTGRYIFDDYELKSSDSGRTFQTRPTFEQEINVLTHSYAYHPDFLNMDLGGGVLFSQQDFESDQGKNNSKDTLYNLTATLNFLESKPYPVRLYYKRSNPSVTTSLSGRFLVENTRYGVRASLLEPVSPVGLNVELFRFDSKGEGFDTSIDQSTDQAAIRAFKSYGGGNNLRVAYLLTETDSRSGSPALPIQQTVTTTRTTDVTALNLFGNRKQLRLTQLLTFTDQDLDIQTQPSTNLKDLRYISDLRWDHSETTRSFYQYRLLKSDRSDINTTAQSARAGAAYEPKQGLYGNADVHGEKEDQDFTNFRRTLYGALASGGYRRNLRYGSLQLGTTFLYDRTDQSSSADIIRVFDENVTLSGTTPVPLQNDFIVTGSVVVTNVPKTQTYIEGIDYTLRVIGSSTEIQRLIGGNIVDGQIVLVNYDYRSGGTVKFDTFSQNYFASLDVFRYYSFSLRYRDLNQSVTSGRPTTPLNSIQNLYLSARVEYPLPRGWIVGAEVNYEDQDEDISPFTRTLYRANVETTLPRASRLRLTGRREFVDNKLSLEDVDLTRFTATFTSRPWLRTMLKIEADFEEDTGGTQDRRRIGQNISLVWRYRQLQFTVWGENIENKQGDVTQDNTKIRAQLVRTF